MVGILCWNDVSVSCAHESDTVISAFCGWHRNTFNWVLCFNDRISSPIHQGPRVCCIQTVSWKCQSLSDTVGHSCTSYSHQDTRALSVSPALDCLSSCAAGARRGHSKLLYRSYIKIFIWNLKRWNPCYWKNSCVQAADQESLLDQDDSFFFQNRHWIYFYKKRKTIFG